MHWTVDFGFSQLRGFEQASEPCLAQPYTLLVGYWGDSVSLAHLDVSEVMFTVVFPAHGS